MSRYYNLSSCLYTVNVIMVGHPAANQLPVVLGRPPHSPFYEQRLKYSTTATDCTVHLSETISPYPSPTSPSTAHSRVMPPPLSPRPPARQVQAEMCPPLRQLTFTNRLDLTLVSSSDRPPYYQGGGYIHIRPTARASCTKSKMTPHLKIYFGQSLTYLENSKTS